MRQTISKVQKTLSNVCAEIIEMNWMPDKSWVNGVKWLLNAKYRFADDKVSDLKCVATLDPPFLEIIWNLSGL